MALWTSSGTGLMNCFVKFSLWDWDKTLCCNPLTFKLSYSCNSSGLCNSCKCSYQTPWLQSSPPPGHPFRSRRTPGCYGNTLRYSTFLTFLLFCGDVWQSSVFLTCSQVSRIMTSSVARSSWVISPGTSSICQGRKGCRGGLWGYIDAVAVGTQRAFWSSQTLWHIYI